MTAKHITRPRQTKPKEDKEEATVTKFQLEPPSHKSKPARTRQLHKQSDQANEKNSAPPITNNGRNKAFRSDVPVPKKAQEGEKSSNANSKKPSKPHKSNSDKNEEKNHLKSRKLSTNKTKNSTKDIVTTTKPAKTTTAKKQKTTVKRTTPAKIKAATAKKKSKTTVRKTSTSHKTKATTVKKTTKKVQHKKKTNPQSGVLDLLRLLNGDYKSARQKKSQEGSLHVVLGKLAIPIKIIPDD